MLAKAAASLPEPGFAGMARVAGIFPFNPRWHS